MALLHHKTTSTQSEPLRILLLNSARRWIGEAAHTLALAEGLTNRGHRVLLGLRRGYALEAVAEKACLPLLSLEMNSRFHLYHDPADAFALRRAMCREHIQIVHCNRGKDHWQAAAARMLTHEPPALVRGRHVVVPVRQHAANRWLYKHATDGLYSVSRAAQNSLGPLRRLVGTPGPDHNLRDRVIYASVDVHTFRPALRDQQTRHELGVEPEDVLIGLIGRIQRVKGQRYFLQAAAALSKQYPHARFLLAGKGTENQRQILRNYAKETGLDPTKLIIRNYIEDLPRVLASLDIGAIASIGSEGSSRIALECMAVGIPIVATTVGGIPELLEDGKQAWLVPPKDPEAMSRKLASLIENPEERTRMGKEGHQTAHEYFHPDRWLDEIETFYRDIMSVSKHRTL